MRKNNLFITLGLAFGFSAGAIAGLALKGSTLETKAAAMYSGSIIIQKNDATLKSRGKLVAYLFNDKSSNWGVAIDNNPNTYQEYSWSLAFEPTKLIILNVSDEWESGWDCSARTGDVPLSSANVVWMTNDASDKNSNWGYFTLDARVLGGAEDSWSVATVDTALTNFKTDGNKIEAYGAVALPANTYFKTVKLYGKTGESWHGNYTSLSAISSNLSGGGASNIHNTVAATYEFYFDYEGGTTYITDPAIAAADEFAVSFISKTDGYCSASISASVQSILKGEYDALPSSAQEAFYEAEVKRGKGLSYASTASEALSRYANMQEEYDYSDFLDLGTNNPKSASKLVISPATETINNSSILVLTLSIGTVAAAAMGAYCFIRRKKEDR